MLHKRLNIYKHIPYVREGYDPSNGGISGRMDEIEVFAAEVSDEDIAEWCFYNDKRIEDVCRLNKRMLWGEKHYFIEPVVKPKHMVGPMFGGSFADTSDGAWAEILGERTGRPVPIHDRFETQEQYNALSC